VRVGALCAVAGRVFGARNPPPTAVPEAAGPEVAGPAPEPVPGLVGDTPAMHALFGSIRAFAPMPWPALILGETGTGKEAVARALHACSPRADAPLVAVNCGAIVASLAESTLFGHERGAFTGADRRQDGLLAHVDDGTLFLDEVGELSPDLQVKLLRVLQEGVYRRVGGRDDQPFRGRVVAATHRGLDRAETRGAFREDLFYRLAAAILRVPPLSERRADVPALARHLLDRSVAQLPPDLRPERVALPPATLAHLRGRAWPGNVRELENTLRQALALALARGEGAIWPADLGAPGPPASPSVPAPEAAAAVEPAAPTAPASTPAGDPVPLKQAVDRFQRRTIEATLATHGGNASATARHLQVSRQWLHRLMARWEDP
jgi:two-component system NtrC family response regulator